MTIPTPIPTDSNPSPRLRSPDRNQVIPVVLTYDELLPPDHPTRSLWQFVSGLDLSALYDNFRSIPGQPGAPAIDRHLILALWLQAIADGVSSSRELMDLTQKHSVYRWLCGGVSVAYHTLADFRTQNGTILDHLLTQSLATLELHGFLDISRVAQDGMRVRGAAGTSSYRRSKTIDEALEKAKVQLELLRSKSDEDPAAGSRRATAAKIRGAEDKVERLKSAQQAMVDLAARNQDYPPSRQKPEENLRVSTTDPECQKMKMPNGGFNPSYNVQFATTTKNHVIVGVDVSTSGSDSPLIPPMLDQIEERVGDRPEELLVDGGYGSHKVIEEAETEGTKVYSPIKTTDAQKTKGVDPHAPKKGEGTGMTNYRARMGTEAGKKIYKERASTAEWSNAGARNRGLYRVTVRGTQKVKCVALLYALYHNINRCISLMSKKRGDTARRSEG